MKIPLHIPHAVDTFGRRTYVANLKVALPKHLRVRAQMAFLMTQLGAMVARRSKTSSAQVNGFRVPSTKKWPGSHLDLSYADRCLVEAGMTPAPQRPPIDRARAEAELFYRSAVRRSKYPSLTNYEQGQWLLAQRHPKLKHLPREAFIGCRTNGIPQVG